MIDGWIIPTAALTYIGFLFAVAYYGDRQSRSKVREGGRPVIYALSLAVYCTSWTFFGSVGLSATTGLNFIPVYLGASLMIGAGWPLLRRIIRLSKAHNITSTADFIAARYGKSQLLAAIVTVIAVAGTLPYIALQLKAVSESVTTLIGPVGMSAEIMSQGSPLGDLAFVIAMAMAAFSILFGTRYIDTTEHQEGLMLAIATESMVKLLAFLTVGAFITFGMFGGLGALMEQAAQSEHIVSLFSGGFNGGTWLTVTVLSMVCIILLPRQFHVAVVENNSESELRMAAWLFPLYLILINLFVVPIAIAGLLTFPNGNVDADMFVLALPMSANAPVVTLLAFIGGLSAATAMVIVATVALSIMVCNDLVIPFILHRKTLGLPDRDDMGTLLLNIRRSAIFAILLLAYAVYRLIGDSYALASIGLLSFAAIAQFAPAFFGGMFWRRATARGAIAGIVAGFAVWAYTLLLPSLAGSGLVSQEFLHQGPFGIGMLRPQMLFNLKFDPLTHGVIWSLFSNIIAYVGFSLSRLPEPIERLQANAFIDDEFLRPYAPAFRLSRTSVTINTLKQTAARYLGEERTERSFTEYAANRDINLSPHSEADIHVLRFTEHLLASAIGAASSRLVLSLLLRRKNVGRKAALKLLDDASEALQYNRDLLQSALDQVRQGISVFDKDLRLICWNRQFRELLDLPPELGRVGVPLDEIIRFNAANGNIVDSSVEDIVSDRIKKYAVTKVTFQERLDGGNKVIEIRTESLPQGGIVTTYTDITGQVASADALARANETLERRVRERTAELTNVNKQLALAKSKADEANLDKTRFLAAASHDILQPLNAARLFAASLDERKLNGEDGRLVASVDASLEAVEDILNALLDISRLDSGVMKPELSVFPIKELLDQLKLEFEPLAKDDGLELRVIDSGLFVHSDRRLLRRVLQNLVSNAIKYTEQGGVLLGCRRRGAQVIVQIWDTGPGIPDVQQSLIFKEFQRLKTGAKMPHGVGLGLSIVERIGRVLKQPITLNSEVGKGSVFSVTLPMAEPASMTHRPLPARTRIGNIAGQTVLCIDNEPTILEGMEMLLSGWQCQVLCALSIAEANEQVSRHRNEIDVIIADYHLNDGTGLDAIRQIRTELGYEVAAVVISADRSPEVQKRVRGLGLTLLRKPLKPAQLRAFLSQSFVRRTAAE